MIGRAKLRELREAASQVLAPVNEVLQKMKVPMGHLREKAGLYESGEVQLLGVSEEESHVNVGGLLASVLYTVKAPFSYKSGETQFKVQSFRVSHSNGMVVVPVLNGKYVLMNKQYRFPVQCWVTEFPRCFTYHQGACEMQISEIFGHYRYQWFFEKVQVLSWMACGTYFQDTGTDSAQIPVYILDLEGDEEEIRAHMKQNFNSAHAPCKFYLKDMEGLKKYFSKREGISSQDILAWHFAREKLEDIMEVC